MSSSRQQESTNVYSSMNGQKQCKYPLEQSIRRWNPHFQGRNVLPHSSREADSISLLSFHSLSDRSAFPDMSFTPYYPSSTSMRTSQSSSSSSSSFSFSSSTPLFSRRASYSSSDDSEEELETPNSSPQLIGLDAKQSTNGKHVAGGGSSKGKGKALSLEDLHEINGEIIPFSLLEIEEEEQEEEERTLPQRPTFGTPLPLPTPAQSQPSTSSTQSLVYPPGLPIPPSLLQTSSSSSPAPSPAPSTPAPSTRPSQPSPPSRQQEEASRGRSRWPRILWSSELDQESISVLRSYHSRVVGGDLPVLQQGMSPREVQKWSRKMEDAGL
ncbi:uncharacterized protein JCM6883_007302 [Sporobolomyces salmoneus]|uniref:uncharacterized protein n=1 Tax=Sporobolomyces salmoneus TaxID=183962 RepID=UPI00316B8C59